MRLHALYRVALRIGCSVGLSFSLFCCPFPARWVASACYVQAAQLLLLLQLQRLDMEARSYSPDQARQLLQKAKEYKADLAKLKEDARRAGGGAGAAADTRAELGLAGDFYQVRRLARTRLPPLPGKPLDVPGPWLMHVGTDGRGPRQRC